jgi:hypothetical protein
MFFTNTSAAAVLVEKENKFTHQNNSIKHSFLTSAPAVSG